MRSLQFVLCIGVPLLCRLAFAQNPSAHAESPRILYVSREFWRPGHEAALKRIEAACVHRSWGPASVLGYRVPDRFERSLVHRVPPQLEMKSVPPLKRREHMRNAEENVAILRRHLLDKVPVSDLCEEVGLQPRFSTVVRRSSSRTEHLPSNRRVA